VKCKSVTLISLTLTFLSKGCPSSVLEFDVLFEVTTFMTENLRVKKHHGEHETTQYYRAGQFSTKP
jgi:hypothetical protein